MLTADRYRLLEMLGRGGMGEVWRAEDTTLGREVAVKLLLDTAAVPDARERFRQEARTAAGLNHPHLLAVHDFGEDEGHCYLVMELVHGRSLRAELAEKGPLKVDAACRIAGEAAAGLAAAHRAGVVHRDIKPGNLLLAEGGVKVADFGIARATAAAACALTTTGQILGTLAYLAPERARGRPAGPTADVYALGCVLYEMLCGRPPFVTDDVPAVVAHQHIDADPVPPRQLRAEVPAAVEALVLHMLAKDPAARPPAVEVAERLGVAARTGDPVAPAGRPSSDPTTADPTRTLSRPCRTRRVRRTAVLTGLAAAALCASTAVGYALLPVAAGPAGAPPRSAESAVPTRPASLQTPRRTAAPQPLSTTERQRTRHPAAASALPRGEAAKEAPGARKQAEQEVGRAGGAGRRRQEGERKRASEDSGKRRGATATHNR